jgi:hypothetical protein
MVCRASRHLVVVFTLFRAESISTLRVRVMMITSVNDSRRRYHPRNEAISTSVFQIGFCLTWVYIKTKFIYGARKKLFPENIYSSLLILFKMSTFGCRDSDIDRSHSFSLYPYFVLNYHQSQNLFILLSLSLVRSTGTYVCPSATQPPSYLSMCLTNSSSISHDRPHWLRWKTGILFMPYVRYTETIK